MQHDTPDSHPSAPDLTGLRVKIEGVTTRGQTIAARMERLGITQVELAKLAQVDRGALRRAIADEPSSTARTYGKVGAALDRLEHELGMDEVGTGERVTSTVTLATGERITFSGDPAGVAEAAMRFLAKLRANVGGDI